MTEMRDILSHIKEENLFPGADDAELLNRTNDKQKERRKKELAWEKENGRQIDHCPSCGEDLRSGGIYAEERVIVRTPMEYNPSENTWDYGDRQEEDNWNDDLEYFCAACEDQLEHGEDFSVSF